MSQEHATWPRSPKGGSRPRSSPSTLPPVAVASSASPKTSNPRATSLDALGALRPAFHSDGTVTAGDASGINDGAAALVLASDERVSEFALPVVAMVIERTVTKE